MNLLRSALKSSLLILTGIAAVTGCSHAAEQTSSSEGAQTATAGVPAVGTYQLVDNEYRSASLAIKLGTASSIIFDLEIYNGFAPYNQGFVSDATASGANGIYKHTSEDCELTFKVSAASIEVEQQGGCLMGNNVIADGSFKPTPPPPTVASLCSPTEEVIFACKAANSTKTISICGYRGAAQYRYGTANKVELALPKAMAPIFDQPKIAEGGFISLAGAGAGGAFATFHNGDYDYSVVTINSSLGRDANDLSNGTENTSGVLVLNKGKRVAFVKCAEEPTSDLPSELIAESPEPFDLLLLPY